MAKQVGRPKIESSEAYLNRMREIMLTYGFGSQIIQYMLIVEGYKVPKSRVKITQQMDSIRASFTDDEIAAYEQRNKRRQD